MDDPYCICTITFPTCFSVYALRQCWDRAGELIGTKNICSFPGGKKYAVSDMGQMLEVTKGSQEGELVCGIFCVTDSV